MPTIKSTARCTLAPLLMVLSATFATACSQSSRPTDAEVESAVRAAALANGHGKIATVENVKRVNGYDDAQTKDYVADVTYDFVFTKSFADITKGREKMTPPVPDEITFALAFMGQNKAWNAGDRFPQHDKFPFHKTEKGWQLDSN